MIFGDDLHKYKDGDTRIVSGYLVVPKTIAGVTRWLEHASWEQVFNQTPLTKESWWEDVRWVS